MASPPRYASATGPHGPRAHRPLMVAAATVLGLAVVAGSVLLGTYIGSQRSPATSTPGPRATAPAVPTAAPSATAAPTATPRPEPGGAPAPLAGFGAGPFSGGSPMNGEVSSVGAVRMAAQSGYDRFVLDLGQSPLQQYEVRTQATSRFTLDPKGEVVTLGGARGLLIVLRNASNHDSFSGAADVMAGLSAIREARLVGDFEGVVSWGLGVDGPGFVRVLTLTNPSRLVVDVQT
jgi:hypothetical protein